MLKRFKERLRGIFEAVKSNLLSGEYDWEFGKIAELDPLLSGKWEIIKEKSKVTGIAYFSIKAKKYHGVIRVQWERYRNGDYFAHVIDDADGFEIFNRAPAIYPPEIEIEPGTYVWRAGAFRGIILTFTETDMSLDYIDADGFIFWEQRSRYEMVGKRLHLIEPMKRFREKISHGYTFTEWKKYPDKAHPTKKNSNRELEVIMLGRRKQFMKESQPLVKGSRGYAYKSGERIKGFRMPSAQQRSNQDQAGTLDRQE